MRRLRCLLPVLFTIILLAPGTVWAQGEVRIREDADTLLKTENKAKLDALKLAFKTLQEKIDPKTGISSMYFWAYIHGAPAGEDKPVRQRCEHENELIWPWHRAYLYQFETALRESNPPMTSNVTLPYWNWAANPSGSRYPKIFEEPGSPLNYKARLTAPSSAPLPSDIEDNLLNNNPTWWDEDSQTGFGGGAMFGQSGALEDQAHNTVHMFIGIDNGNTDKAARDPIFWAHHANLDRIWVEWTAKYNEQPHGLTKPLRNGLPGTVQDWLDISQKYKYGPKANLTPTQQPLHFAQRIARGAPTAPLIKLISPPKFDASQRLRLSLKNIQPPKSSENFLAVDVYLHPEGESLLKGDAAFKKNYHLTHFALWDSGHAEHSGTPKHGGGRNVTLDVTNRARAILKTTGDKKLVLSLQFIGNVKGDTAEYLSHEGDNAVRLHQAEFVVKAAPAPKKVVEPDLVPPIMTFPEERFRLRLFPRLFRHRR